MRRRRLEAEIAARKAARDHEAVFALMVAAMTGKPVTIVATSEAEAKRLYRDALEMAKAVGSPPPSKPPARGRDPLLRAVLSRLRAGRVRRVGIERKGRGRG